MGIGDKKKVLLVVWCLMIFYSMYGVLNNPWLQITALSEGPYILFVSCWIGECRVMSCRDSH